MPRFVDRVIIHADLGRIEHAESIDHVRALASFLDWPLIICKREKGDLLDRYEQRCARPHSLACSRPGHASSLDRAGP